MKNVSPRKAFRPEILSGWKDIATYLGRGVRTVQRYERELSLPVRRPAGKSAASVIATKAELDAWVTASPFREVFRLPQDVDITPPLAEFRRRVQEAQRLANETAELRAQVRASLELLQENLRSALPPQDQTREPQRLKANVLAFDPKKKAL